VHSRIITLTLRALVVVPAILGACLILRFGVDVPFWDEWTIAEYLEAADQGTLTIATLFEQHNEHRMLVPKALQLAVARMAGSWDTRIIMWITQAVLAGMLIVCTVLWRQSLVSRAPWTLVTLALLSWILYSPAQHQNLLWGFQICFYVPAACLLASAMVTSSGRTEGSALGASAAFSALGTFSILPGLLGWPLSAGAVAARYGLPSRATALKWSLWSVCCGLAVAVYFFRYERPSHSPSAMAMLGHPAALLASIATVVGGPLTFGARPVRNAILIGAATVVTLFWLIACVWRKRADAALVARANPWIVMGAFGFLSAVAIAIGRGGYGYLALLEPRYAALTGWILTSVVMLAAILRDRSAFKSSARAWVAVCGAIAALSAAGLPHHVEAIRSAHRERLQSQAVYTFADAASNGQPMVPAWLDWSAIRRMLSKIETTGWRQRHGPPTWVEAEASTNCAVGIVEFAVPVGSRVTAGGWAFLPSRRPADAILLTVGSSRRIAAVHRPLIGRKDVGDRFRTDDALVSGWVIDAGLPQAAEPAEFWAVDVESLRAYRLCEGSGLVSAGPRNERETRRIAERDDLASIESHCEDGRPHVRAVLGMDEKIRLAARLMAVVARRQPLPAASQPADHDRNREHTRTAWR
jgi:hypothetical protein